MWSNWLAISWHCQSNGSYKSVSAKLSCSSFKLLYRIASDIVGKKLAVAQVMGADITVDSSKEDLQETGRVYYASTCYIVIILVMKETDGDGIGCIVDASGVPNAVNNCFSMLRYKSIMLYVINGICIN